jgi:hypothetical protein
MKKRSALLFLLWLVACSPTPPAGSPDAPEGGQGNENEAAPPPPWGQAPLAAAQLPPVYLEQWRRAENRATCAPIAPISLGVGEGAAPRAATFSGGWAVAYDQSGLRSAFGVAGTGAAAAAPSYDEWPFSRRWSDGSSAGYGPEGGSGENQLAYLRIAGQGCLYNVWSRIAREHLEHLLEQLRFVAVE